jgi:nitrogen-specific signal transduction histidine kinase
VKLFQKETWSYAVLLVILFAIATIAVWQTIVFLETRVPADEIPIVTTMLWTLTLGFMLIAGAFGLWAIQFAGAAESSRRIAAIIESMDYIQDGLLAVDTHDRLTACNPAGAAMMHAGPYHRRPLAELFTSLQPNDVELLLHDPVPQEVERSHIDEGLTHTLRFRSQPSHGVTLILVSDVTRAQASRKHHQQAAKLQLVGQLARAVANDFNNLLCGIAGHAALLPRLPAGAGEVAESIQAIAEGAERGIGLAGHLMELSRPLGSAQPTSMIDAHVTTAANALRDSLPAGWNVDIDVMQTPATALTGMQIEQLVLNLGQIITAEAGDTGVISIILGPPGSHPLLHIDDQFAGGIVLTCSEVGSSDVMTPHESDGDDAGIILSVIQSILDGAGGALNQLTGADRHSTFRLSLPVATAVNHLAEQAELPFDIDRYLANWNVLIAGHKHRHLGLLKRIEEMQAEVTLVDTIAAVLAATEGDRKLDAVIIDWPLLGSEEEGALKALAKLSPGSGIVVLRDTETRTSGRPLPGVVYAPSHANVDSILMALVEARSLAAARGRTAPG